MCQLWGRKSAPYSHGVPRIGNLPVAGQAIAGLLIEPVPDVGVLPLAEAGAGHVPGLVEVVPREPAVGGLEGLQGQGEPRPGEGGALFRQR